VLQPPAALDASERALIARFLPAMEALARRVQARCPQRMREPASPAPALPPLDEPLHSDPAVRQLAAGCRRAPHEGEVRGFAALYPQENDYYLTPPGMLMDLPGGHEDDAVIRLPGGRLLVRIRRAAAEVEVEVRLVVAR
jgi:hypothetical protein